MNDAVVESREGHVAVLTLNRADTRNAIDAALVDGLVAACERLDRDLEVRAVVLTGTGGVFSSGGNIKDMRIREGLFGGSPAEMRARYREGIQRIPLALYHLEVPTIAAVNGPAIGAGCDLALMCDIRIAAERARFAESFVKLGIIPGDGGAWLLPRAVGLSRASEMAFTGDPVDARTAAAWGLVSKVVSDERVLEESMALARRIAGNPPEVLRMTKRLIREGQRTELETLLEMSAAFQAVAQHTADHREAVGAMAEKREPRFTGQR